MTKIGKKSPKSARRVRLEFKCFFISAWWPGSLLAGPSGNFHCNAPSLVPMYEIWIKQYIHFQLIHASKKVLVGRILISPSKLPTKIFSLQEPITGILMSSDTDFLVGSYVQRREKWILAIHLFFYANTPNHGWWCSTPNPQFEAMVSEAKLASLG